MNQRTSTAPGAASTPRRSRPRAPEPARRIVGGRYVLQDRIGAGTSSDVWRALDEANGTEVAVKLLHAWLLPDRVSRLRFESEARAVERLRHPRIVAVRDVVLGDDEAAIVMDLVPGGTLADLLGRVGRIPPRRAASIAADLASALEAAHSQGVVHRDVKPGNVLLDSEGRPRLADFGIARSLDDSQGLTVTGTVMGSLRYMAPEQLAGASPGPAADVFALGAVLYEMLAGRPAFDATSPAALVEQHHREPPKIADVDPALASIALATLRREAGSRIASAAALEEALRSWLSGGRVALPPNRAPAAAANSRRAQRRPVLAVVVAGAALALAAAAIAVGWSGLGQQPSSPGPGGVAGLVAGPSGSPSATTASTPTPRATPRVVKLVGQPATHHPAPPRHHGHGGGQSGGDGGD